jgi:cellulose synthase/poly-beta-1,6-N-acetylglucosamine synthase-like glycosyltransferase
VLNGGIDEIPNDLLDFFEKNMNPEYQYKLEKDVPINNQQMLDTTKTILSILFRDYWATEEQKRLIIKKENYEKMLEDKAKREKYGTKIEFDNKKTEDTQQLQMIVYKENKFFKIIRRILNFFKSDREV